MITLTRYALATLLPAVLATGFATAVLGQGAQPGTIIGATSMIDDAPLKSKAGMELERAMEKAQAAGKIAAPPDPLKLAIRMGIQTAQDLIKVGKYPESLARLAELDTIADKTASDVYLIERTRIAIASFTDDKPLLVHSIEAVMNLPVTPATERIQFSELLARTYFNLKNFARTIAWSTRYFDEGGNDMAIRRALVLSYYLSNDFARARQEVSADIQMEEQTGGKPSEEQLRLLVSCAQKLDDKPALSSALEKYAAYYPKAK